MKKIITIYIITLFLMLNPLPLFSKNIIIVPPLEFYIDGFERSIKKNECEPNKKRYSKICNDIIECKRKSYDHLARLFSYLGRNIYLNMISSIVTFNKDKRSLKQKINYQLISVAAPICINNRMISDFYSSVKNNNFKLKNSLKKRKSDVIFWVDYDQAYRDKIKHCVENQTNSSCNINIIISMYDGEYKKQNLELEFIQSNMSFSEKSYNLIKDNVYKSLIEKEFKKNSKKRANKIIIVPPLENYTYGYENDMKENKCNTRRNKNSQKCIELINCKKNSSITFYQLLSNLGRNIYFKIISSINIFNEDKPSLNHKIKYQLINAAEPICKNNEIISSFYKKVNKKNYSLKRILKKKNCDVLIWVDYDQNYKNNIKQCTEKTNNSSCKVDIVLFMYDGEHKKENISLTFKKKYMNFSKKSFDLIQKKVYDFLIEKDCK